MSGDVQVFQFLQLARFTREQNGALCLVVYSFFTRSIMTLQARLSLTPD